MNHRNQKITTYFVILSLLVIGIVYAILQANLQINGIAKIKSNSWDIHFDNIQVNEDSVSIGTGDSPATIDSNDTSKVDFSVTLSTPGDFYEFTVDVVNSGTIDGMIELLTEEMKVNNEVVQETPNYLNYIVTYEDDSSILLKHLLEAGETLTYKVRLEFKTDIEELPEAATINSSFGVQFVQADDTAIKKRPYYSCTYDGELVQGAEYTNGQYTYRYMQEYGYNSSTSSYEWQNIENDGWGVRLSDPTSTDSVTSRLCTSINDKPIVSMRQMFYNSKTTNIDTSSFNTSNVINMNNMFSGCNSLTDIDVTKFDTSNVTNMSGMFAICSSLTDIDVTEFDTSNVTNMSAMFFDCSGLSSLDLTGFDTSNVTLIDAMFYNCRSLTELDLSSFDTSKVTNMSSMFYSCISLTELDLSSFDTSKVTNMSSMFYSCISLTELDLSSFDTSKVTNMGSMFYSCISLTELDLSGFDFSNYNPGSIMMNISGGGFHSLKVLNMTGAKLPSNLYYAFGGLRTVEQIILDDVDTSLATTMNFMFNDCISLKNINVSHFNTSNVTNMQSMFMYCSSLTSIDLSSFNTSNVTNTDNMFNGCTSLSTGYARTQADATKFNNSSNKPSGVTFVVKS